MYVWGWNESGQLGLPNGKESDSTSTDKTRIKTELVDKREQSQRVCSNSSNVCSFCKTSVAPSPSPADLDVKKKSKIKRMFMKHCTPNHMIVHKNDTLS